MTDSERQPSALLLSAGAQRVAVPVDSVREVIDNPVVTKVPTLRLPSLGVIVVRGAIVPLYALSAFGNGEGPWPDGTMLLVVTLVTEMGTIAVAVEEQPRVVVADADVSVADPSRVFSSERLHQWAT